MMNADLELIYLLSAYGAPLYGLAMARTEDAQKSERILQKIFLELVNFPPRAEGDALQAALLKKVARLAPSKIKTADPLPLPKELEEELLALMKEAREHEGILPPKRPLWRKGHTILASCLALCLILTLTLTFALNGRGETYQEEMGSGALLTPAPTKPIEPPKQEEQQPLPQEELYPFETIEAPDCTTYASLAAFVHDIEGRTAKGYGSGYYTAPDLLLLPTRLPDGAKFRCLYLNPQSGDYTYSFQFEAEGALYLIEFSAYADHPASALEVPAAIGAAQGEKTSRSIQGATLTATFGKDQITATLTTPESDAPIDEKAAKKLLKQITLERCNLDNPFLQQ